VGRDAETATLRGAFESALNPLRALIMFSSFPFDASVLVDGELVPAMRLPATYLPLQLAVRLPEVVLCGVATALVFGALALRPRALFGALSLRVGAVALAALFPIVYSVLARPVDYNGMRHFLFVVPPLTVLAALAYDRLLAAVPAALPRYALALAIALATLPPARSMFALHPDEYVYFNSLVGGPRGAQGRFELDYWGISLAEASRRLTHYLTQHHDLPKPGQAPFKVYVCGSAWSAATFFPPWLRAVDRLEDADFQIAIAQHYCKHAPGSRRLLGVMRSGALLSYVEDLRHQAAPQPNARDRSRRERALSPPPRKSDPT